jgi:uncharacterized protein YukJ
MALKNYGVLKGRPIDRRLGFGRSPHYQVHLVDDDDDFRIAVNVKSKQSPSELLYMIEENYAHPLVDDLKEHRPVLRPSTGCREGRPWTTFAAICLRRIK